MFAERAGENKCWHTTCFSCTKCGEMLEDLLYFFKDGQLFCGRDFAEIMNIPRCSACDELIFSSSYTLAEDKFWHEDHFCCWLCDRGLAGQAYIPVGGQPYCMECWQGRYGKHCQACRQYIQPQDKGVQLGEQHWHARGECFRCGVCGNSLMGGRVARRGGVVVCGQECGEVAKHRADAVREGAASQSGQESEAKSTSPPHKPQAGNPGKKVSYYATNPLHARKPSRDLSKQDQAETRYSTIV